MTPLDLTVRVVFSLSLGALGLRHLIRFVRSRKTRRGLRVSTPIEDLGTFEEALPRFHAGPSKQPHAVLLLHGYSASTDEFTTLTQALRQAGIPHHAPMLTGFGLADCKLLSQTRHTDWLRDAVLAYDLLKSLAEEVSIVGHSTGASLAAYVAQHRRVKHLVLSGPNLIPSAEDLKYKTLLRTPVLATLLPWLIPFFSKPVRPGRTAPTDTLDPEAAARCCHYEALPTSSLIASYDLQDLVDLSAVRYETLTILHGEHDVTVDVRALLEQLERASIDHQEILIPNSGHNILEDYEKDAATARILRILES